MSEIDETVVTDVEEPKPRRRGRPRKKPAVETTSTSTADVLPVDGTDGVKGAKKSVSRPRKAAVVAAAEKLGADYIAVGMLLSTSQPGSRAHRAGLALVANGEACGKAWADAAQTSPAVARVLVGGATVSVWVSLAAVHAPIALAIMARTSDDDDDADDTPVAAVR